MPHRKAEKLVAPVFAILGISILVVAAILAYTARAQDRLASGTSGTVVESILRYEQSKLADIAYDLAWWDDLITNVYLDYDEDWIAGNLGEYLNESFDIASIFVFDGADRLVIGGIDAEPWPNGVDLPIEGGLEALASEARRRAGGRPEPVTGFLWIAGEVHFAAVAAVVPDDLPRGTLGRGPSPVLLLTRRLDGIYLEAVGPDFNLSELGWVGVGSLVVEDTAGGRLAWLPVASADGAPMGDLVWLPDRPGWTMLVGIAPWAILALAVLIVPLAVFLQRSQRVVAALRESREQFRKQAQTDALTRAHSRGYFFDLSRRALADARRHGHSLSMAVLDLDHFKRVNDTYGHDTGDELLRHFVRICKDNLRKTDFLGRIGGEEFAATLPHTEIETALEVVERLRSAVASGHLVFDGTKHQISASIGVAELDDRDASLHALMKRADEALYRAKQTGRDRVVAAGA